MDATPLAGRRVVVTRAAAQARPLVSLLEAAGAEVLVFPAIEIVDPDDFGPADDAIRRLDVYSWAVFTSANAVERFFTRMACVDKDARALHGLRVAAVGPATAEALGAQGIRPDFVPDEYVGEGLLEGLCIRGVGEGTRVLIPRALEAREVLPEELVARGARVDVVPVYRTVPGAGDPEVLARLAAGEADAVTFTSSSTVREFARLTAGIDLGGVVVACIGPVTAATARELGMDVAVEPSEYTVPALVEALGTHFAALGT
ncbi:MAG TPA: uroporphyrinogen-III synthase [Coriobacteriia bacterium]|nr:uroporphyrinogen-III synthase [Coriobacteriia bacterium]